MNKLMKSFLLLGLISAVGTTAIVYAATNHETVVKEQGKETLTVIPQEKEVGNKAEVIYPTPVEEKEEIKEDEKYEQFIPSIKDDDPFVDIDENLDFSTQVDYTGATLNKNIGNFNLDAGKYTSTSATNIYSNMSKDYPFAYGTYSVDLKTNGGDAGIIFGLSSKNSTFWEGNGISYYFAFINASGDCYLGKTDNGVWSALEVKSIANFDGNQTYNLKVLYFGSKILVFVNGQIALNYRDMKKLSGTGWGIRTGIAGTEFSNLTISSKVTIE